MDIVKNLICLENDKASVIRFMSDHLEFIKKDGEIYFSITTDFWTWWKKVVSYIDGEPVDICFVYDKNYDLLQERDILKNNIINSEDSIWEVEHIKTYFWKLRPVYFNLVIVGAEQQEYLLGGNQDAIARRFQTNLNFAVQKTTFDMKGTDAEKEGVSQIGEEDYTEFAKFFVDLIRRERG